MAQAVPEGVSSSEEATRPSEGRAKVLENCVDDAYAVHVLWKAVTGVHRV